MPDAPSSSSAVERGAVERLALGGALHLDEAAAARHDDVDVDLGGRVLLVVEVEHRLALDDAARDGGDAAPSAAARASLPRVDERR